jgi:hypothetical protein
MLVLWLGWDDNGNLLAACAFNFEEGGHGEDYEDYVCKDVEGAEGYELADGLGTDA